MTLVLEQEELRTKVHVWREYEHHRKPRPRLDTKDQAWPGSWERGSAGNSKSGVGTRESPLLNGRSPIPSEEPGREVIPVGQQGSELAVAVRVREEPRPKASDGRELVPAQGGRVTGANARNLRLRLEQLETQSSWHSGGTRASQEMPEYSPVSFAPGSSMGQGVQAVNKAAHENLLRAESDRLKALRDFEASTGLRQWPPAWFSREVVSWCRIRRQGGLAFQVSTWGLTLGIDPLHGSGTWNETFLRLLHPHQEVV